MVENLYSAAMSVIRKNIPLPFDLSLLNIGARNFSPPNVNKAGSISTSGPRSFANMTQNTSSFTLGSSKREMREKGEDVFNERPAKKQRVDEENLKNLLATFFGVDTSNQAAEKQM